MHIKRMYGVNFTDQIVLNLIQTKAIIYIYIYIYIYIIERERMHVCLNPHY